MGNSVVTEETLAALKAVLERDECRCDTSVCYWCRNDGWVQVSPETIKLVRAAISTLEGKRATPAI